MDCNDIAYRSLRKDKNMPPPLGEFSVNSTFRKANTTALLTEVCTRVGRASLCLGLCFLMVSGMLLFSSCEHTLNQHYAEMDAFYAESQTLFRVPLDSVERFSDKVDDFILLCPDAQEDPLYPAIEENIRKASVRVTFTVETE